MGLSRLECGSEPIPDFSNLIAIDRLERLIAFCGKLSVVFCQKASSAVPSDTDGLQSRRGNCTNGDQLGRSAGRYLPIFRACSTEWSSPPAHADRRPTRRFFARRT